MILERSTFFDNFVKNIKKNKSFTLTGLTSFSRILLTKYIMQLSKKKVLFITSTEQYALRYQNDLEALFDLQAEILPYQNASVYDGVNINQYDYAKQINLLMNKPDLMIAPVKSFLEKFPSKKFYEKNKLSLKIGDEIRIFKNELTFKIISNISQQKI